VNLPNGREREAEKVVIAALVTSGVSRQTVDEHLDELEGLVSAAGGEVVSRMTQERRTPDPATYIGKGKAAELGERAAELGAARIIIDDELSPAQARNLEKITAVPVVDRSALILDIFASRARSREARTQVELAQLNYYLPRLTRQWTHLSRQGGAGGPGARGGEGETQLELDRRMVRTRISRLKEDLEKIEKNRETQRRSRSTAFTIALVGYTNAGKSTLFNLLTSGNVEAVDKLFATLDAKTQQSFHELPRETVFIDTVGFIRKLPHHLVASFRSTMEEAVSADLVLHVINLAHPQVEEQREVGREVLKDLGIDPKQVIEVCNKSDALAGETDLIPYEGDSVAMSALSGEGLEELLAIIRKRQLDDGETVRLLVPLSEGKLIAQLNEFSEVIASNPNGEGIYFTVWVRREYLHRIEPFIVDDERPVRAANR
jgi:GTPase